MNLKTFAKVIGYLFLILGIAGFMAKDLLGIFHLDTVHSLIHLAVGVFGLLACTQVNSSRLFAKTLGIFYLILGLIGIAVPELFGMMHVAVAEDALHLIVGCIALYFGFLAATVNKNDYRSRFKSV